MNKPETNPIIRAMKAPKSMRAAVNAKCAECMGCEEDYREPNLTNHIRSCSSPKCPIFNFRPYK